MDLWQELETAYKERFDAEPSTPIMVCLMERADAHIITEIINKSKFGGKSKASSGSSSGDSCKKCGRMLTDKEVKFIKDAGRENICYHCEKGLS
ncbi:MAG: hypothetical protein KAJ10_05300 [Thermodesulfovibrionia bacterium]|nr:hypothetical protein [Thermodesulfovibrionia bacterium]